MLARVLVELTLTPGACELPVGLIMESFMASVRRNAVESFNTRLGLWFVVDQHFAVAVYNLGEKDRLGINTAGWQW